MKNEKWWKKSVVYQIYPKSFQDSNGDGIGDLKGILSRLDYLQYLGIEAIWLNPIYVSPQDDNGYDIADYENIDPMFGTMEDMEELIQEAKKRNIRIIMDLVLNHTSDDHFWFKEALKGKENPYHDYYVWKDGDGIHPPTDAVANFGGSVWEYVPELKQYYLHQFSVRQPDLNWDNEKVRKEIYGMINRWIEKGVGGFRLDVIDQIAKEPMKNIYRNGSRLHEYIQEMSKETFQKAELITVGEAWGANLSNAPLYSNPDGSEFSMVFQFGHCELDQIQGMSKWDLAPLPLKELKKNLSEWQEELHGKGWNSLFWNNHDLPRAVSRFGNDGKYRVESAKMLAILLHGMEGTPYIYQGEELGMTNCPMVQEEFRDIEAINAYKDMLGRGFSEEKAMEAIGKKSRDNARTPMQWNDEKNAGFTEGTPWIKVNPNFKEINVEKEKKDPNSVLNFYKKAIELRHEYDVFITGAYHLLLPEDEKIFAYTREADGKKLTVICNFSDETAALTEDIVPYEGTLLLHNYESEAEHTCLRPYEGLMYYTEA